MSKSLRASIQGLQFIDRARKSRGWTRTSSVWCNEALVSEPTLRRFWRQIPIQAENFQQICQAVGVDYNQAIDPNLDSTTNIDWGEAPLVPVFYGRRKELATLKQWIQQEDCHVVNLLGMGGIGKTALSVKFVEQVLNSFEYIIWRSLRHAPPLSEILQDFLEFLSSEQETSSDTSLSTKMSRLMKCIRSHRCLLVFDDLDTLMCGGVSSGEFDEEHRSYGELMRRIAQERHKSCLLLTSREQPQGFISLIGDTLPVKVMKLRGLEMEDALQLLLKENLVASEDELKMLIRLYQGHPLALKMIPETIREIYDGKVSEILMHTQYMPDIIENILNQQFDRLTQLEKELIYWLAIKQYPVSIEELKADIWSSITNTDLINALKSLLRRSMIEKTLVKFNLAPVVSKFTIDKFVKLICLDIKNLIDTQKIDRLEILKSHAMIVANEKIETTSFQIVRKVKDRLYRTVNLEDIEEKLSQIISLLATKHPKMVGYAPENLKYLLTALQLDLHGTEKSSQPG